MSRGEPKLRAFRRILTLRQGRRAIRSEFRVYAVWVFVVPLRFIPIPGCVLRTSRLKAELQTGHRQDASARCSRAGWADLVELGGTVGPNWNRVVECAPRWQVDELDPIQ